MNVTNSPVVAGAPTPSRLASAASRPPNPGASEMRRAPRSRRCARLEPRRPQAGKRRPDRRTPSGAG
eukprot:2689000-Pyramimonas_sp.AAC.1